ncbi:L-aspartate oxidase [uncultured Jatrophihabitans sp.]|uniref:L-aspartate oxidase n=1 Tax=uncultured Jatrophihabitans sp. TaxID=1610747 RepID=UPI0035CA0419
MSTDVDVLIVGAGVAGLSTALGLAATRSVLVLSAGDGSTPWAQGGIAIAFGDDEPADHAADTHVAGAGICDEDAVRVLVEEGPARVAELIASGAVLDRDETGELSRTIEGGHGRPRVVHAGGDATGAEVARSLLATVRAAGVTVLDARVTGLLLDDDDRVVGAATSQGRIRARAVVLATGGIGNAYRASTNPAAVRGDGIALALRAGASVVDMEFVQFHPTVLHTGAADGQLPLVTEAVRGEGAHLLDVRGRRIMAGRHPLEDLAPRDIVAREIDAAMHRDGSAHVWLDATAIDGATLRRRFPTVLASCAAIGVDPAVDAIPVAPAEHFLCGGVRTDRRGATDVPGLYAVGEAAATGVHGANRLASNSLLEGLVFGRRLAGELTLVLPPAGRPARTVELGDDADPRRVQEVLSARAGIRRDASGLATAHDELAALGDGPLATVARAVVVGATTRTESRGCHWRADFPDSSTAWLRPVVVRLGPDGRPVADDTLVRVAS